MSTLENLREIADRSHNYKILRAHLHKINPPCVPYPGIYLTDLTFIEVL